MVYLVCLYQKWCRYGSLARLDDMWCTCGSRVVLEGHAVHVQLQGPLVVTCCTFGSLGKLTVKGCTCGSLGELLVTCETLRELAVTWCTRGSLGMLV